MTKHSKRKVAKHKGKSRQPTQALILRKAAPRPFQPADIPPEYRPHTQDRALSVEPVVPSWALQSGGLVLTPEQVRALSRPPEDDELDVLPTGELYMAHAHIRRRLFAAFGIGGWIDIPCSLPQTAGERTLSQWWALIVQGRYVGMTAGEAQYQPTNKRTSWADALESARSNALKRIAAKNLNVGLECWTHRWADDWVERNCVRVFVRDGDNESYQWRRKDAKPLRGEGTQAQRRQQQGDSSTQPHTRPDDTRPITDPQRARLWALMQQHGVSKDKIHAYLKSEYQIESSKLIPRNKYDDICSWVMRGAA